MNISVDPKKEFDKLQHHFMIKPLGKLGMEQNIVYKKPTPNIIIKHGTLFSQRSGKR